MNYHLWFGFIAASIVVGIVPGPGVLSIVGYAISSGTRTALASVAGMAVGNLFAMTLSLAGVGALLASSATAFMLLKWAGAFYLIWLGILAIRSSHMNANDTAAAINPISASLAFRSNILIGVFHPKTIVFFVAFVPQFIDGNHAYWPQAILLICTFTVVVGITDALYALTAARARSLLVSSKKTKIWMGRAGGGGLVAAGAATLMTKN
ncbi:LysE family translocator [Paenochrobactrum pullorum]|uniref:LysE family translocator n=1 Tax=Paenochrobactrum pullorum TaxID=1324351 RepID=UPI0035BBD714